MIIPFVALSAHSHQRRKFIPLEKKKRNKEKGVSSSFVVAASFGQCYQRGTLGNHLPLLWRWRIRQQQQEQCHFPLFCDADACILKKKKH
jgi:hypothetical protein